MQTERVTPVTEMEIVRLAIELARLRDAKEPERFLDEAARLLTEARFALGREMTRPEREAKKQSERMSQLLAEDFSAQKVPFARICRPATEAEHTGGASELPAKEAFGFRGETGMVEFEWRVYRDERDFKELLEKHAKRIYDARHICSTVGAELERLKKALEQRESEAQSNGQTSIASEPSKLPSWSQLAAALCRDRYWFPDEWQNRFLAVESSEAGEKLVEEYVIAAIPAFQEYLWQMAKEDHLDTCTLFSIHQTRQGTYKGRGPKR